MKITGQAALVTAVQRHVRWPRLGRGLLSWTVTQRWHRRWNQTLEASPSRAMSSLRGLAAPDARSL
jgi:hypothetical protein